MSGPQPNTRVLLVDDEPAVLVMLRRKLQGQQSLTVCGEAADAGQALSLATVLNPDVIVLDWHLPDLSGSEVVAAVTAACPSARIVVYTSDAGAARGALAAGAYQFILKEDLTGLLAALAK